MMASRQGQINRTIEMTSNISYQESGAGIQEPFQPPPVYELLVTEGLHDNHIYKDISIITQLR